MLRCGGTESANRTKRSNAKSTTEVIGGLGGWTTFVTVNSCCILSTGFECLTYMFLVYMILEIVSNFSLEFLDQLFAKEGWAAWAIVEIRKDMELI